MPISVESKQKRAVLEIHGDDNVSVSMRDTYLPHHADCPHVEQARADKAAKDAARKESA